jgi:hypothetical protein
MVFRQASRPDWKFRVASECFGTYGPLSLTVISLHLLEFVTIMLHHMAPNVTGWSSALQYFLSICQYLVGEKVCEFLPRVSNGTEESFRK